MAGEKILIVDDCQTIREIVSDILKRAGYVPLAAEDGFSALKIAQSEAPELAIVDFIMPKMNGLRFCQMFRSIENLKKVPIVLMSVKAGSIGEKFTQMIDISDSISKPFTPDALLAVVNHSLKGERVERGIGHKIPEVESVEVPTLEQERSRAVERIRKLVAERICGNLQHEADEVSATGKVYRVSCDEMEKIVRGSLDEEFLVEISKEFRRVSPLEKMASLWGYSESVTVGDVIQVLSQSGRTGKLQVHSDNKKAEVFFSRGAVKFARLWGGSDEFLLGRYLIKEQLITKEVLNKLLQQKNKNVLLGERLIKMGLISREELNSALEEQTTEVIYEILKWEDSHYVFYPDELSQEARLSTLSLNGGELLMEGYRRVDEWRLIGKEIDDFSMVVKETVHASELRAELSHKEALVLDFIDGERSIKDIIKETMISSFDVCKIIYQFLATKVVKKVE